MTLLIPKVALPSHHVPGATALQTSSHGPMDCSDPRPASLAGFYHQGPGNHLPNSDPAPPPPSWYIRTCLRSIEPLTSPLIISLCVFPFLVFGKKNVAFRRLQKVLHSPRVLWSSGFTDIGIHQVQGKQKLSEVFNVHVHCQIPQGELSRDNFSLPTYWYRELCCPSRFSPSPHPPHPRHHHVACIHVHTHTHNSLVFY